MQLVGASTCICRAMVPSRYHACRSQVMHASMRASDAGCEVTECHRKLKTSVGTVVTTTDDQDGKKQQNMQHARNELPNSSFTQRTYCIGFTAAETCFHNKQSTEEMPTKRSCEAAKTLSRPQTSRMPKVRAAAFMNFSWFEALVTSPGSASLCATNADPARWKIHASIAGT